MSSTEVLFAGLAHQGGWDEIAMVAGPLLVFAAVLYLANRRANLKLAQLAEADHADDPDGSSAQPEPAEDIER